MTADSSPAQIKILAKLPKPGAPERGDGPVAEALLAEDKIQYVLLAVAPKENTKLRATGVRVATSSIVMLEGLTHPEDRRAAQELLERAQRRRISGDTRIEQPMMNWGDD